MEFKDAEILVVKVGTSTLTYDNGKVNLHRLEELCRTLSDLQNSGKEVGAGLFRGHRRRRGKAGAF